MKTHRPLRVASVVREELAKLIAREIDFPRGTLATVTEVFVTNKLDWADVFVSVLPHERSAEVLSTLKDKEGYLQHILNRRMNIRPMPQIRFNPDRGIENAADVEKILMDEDNKNRGHVVK